MATIKEIAQLAQTSTATVSYVLSNKPARISEKTRQRILKIAADLDYQPNALVHALRSKISYAIAVLVPSLKSGFFPEIIAGIDDEVSGSGFQLMICQHSNSPERLKKEIQLLRSRRVDGLIVMPSGGLQGEAKYFSELRRKRVKLVLVEQNQPDIPFVISNNDTGAKQVIDHLFELGHREIGYVGHRDRRLESYCRAMRERGIPVRESHFLIFDEHGPGVEDYSAFLGPKPRFTALAATRDEFLFPLYDYCLAAKLAIPDRLSMVGYANFREGKILSPKLTSVDQNPGEIGREAGRIALDLILERIPQKSHQITLDPKLVVRESTGPAPGTR